MNLSSQESDSLRFLIQRRKDGKALQPVEVINLAYLAEKALADLDEIHEQASALAKEDIRLLSDYGSSVDGARIAKLKLFVDTLGKPK